MIAMTIEQIEQMEELSRYFYKHSDCRSTEDQYGNSRPAMTVDAFIEAVTELLNSEPNPQASVARKD